MVEILPHTLIGNCGQIGKYAHTLCLGKMCSLLRLMACRTSSQLNGMSVAMRICSVYVNFHKYMYMLVEE